MTRPSAASLERQNRLQNGIAPVKRAFGKRHLVVQSNPMADEKTGDAQSLLRMAKDAFRSFAYGGAKEAKPPRVGLALAGGFARGIAHIGVLRVFREANIPIDVVAGTSVGALIGVGYFARESPESISHISLV